MLQRKERRTSRAVYWPRDLEARYGIAAPTRTRWERTGRLPERDFFLEGRPVGWFVETIEGAERAKDGRGAIESGAGQGR